MRDARNGREGCFPGEGNVRGDDDFGLERLVMQRDKGRRPLFPLLWLQEGRHECTREASIPGEENNVQTEQLH
jgi:hypothetical protein